MTNKIIRRDELSILARSAKWLQTKLTNTENQEDIPNIGKLRYIIVEVETICLYGYIDTATRVSCSPLVFYTNMC